MRTTLIFVLAHAVLCGSADAQSIAITNATVYTSPDASAQTHTTILIQGGKVAAVARNVVVPPGVRTLPCQGCVVFAGFWNSHVHFTGPQWAGADRVPAAQLSRDMRAMLTHSGFTTVVDTASDVSNTVVLRRRVQSAEVAGPRIYTAGFALFPPHGIPFYLDDMTATAHAKLQDPATPVEAVKSVRSNISQGSDIVKLFTGSYLSPDEITHMPLEIAQAAASEGHRHGQPIFAHPSDLQGIRVAIDSGVDVLAHAPDTIGGIDTTLVKELVAHHVKMIPTLKLFSGSSHIDLIRKIVAQFHADEGTLLQLALTGLSFHDVLAMLTTNPAAEFKVLMIEDGLKRQDGAAAAYVAAKVAGIRDPFTVCAQYGARQRHADEIRVYVE